MLKIKCQECPCYLARHIARDSQLHVGVLVIVWHTRHIVSGNIASYVM